MISLGGALGAVLVAIVAPLVLPGYFEQFQKWTDLKMEVAETHHVTPHKLVLECNEKYQKQVKLAADGALDQPRLAELLALAAWWKPPRFPLKGRDVTALGIPPGKRVGELLAAVRQWWEESDFAPDRAVCLARLEEVAKAARKD